MLLVGMFGEKRLGLIASWPIVGEVDLTGEQAGFDGGAGTYYESGNITLHDAETGELVRTLTGLCAWYHSKNQGFDVAGEDCSRGDMVMDLPESLAFSPDGSLLAMGGQNSGNIVVWDLESGNVRWRLIPPEQDVDILETHEVEFSPDGSVLVVIDGPRGRVFETDEFGESNRFRPRQLAL